MIKDFLLPALVYVLSFCCHARFKVLLSWDQNVAACADEYQHRTLVQLNDKWFNRNNIIAVIGELQSERTSE